MAITQAMCTSFKKELLEAKHNFLLSGGSTFNLALYTSSATMSAATTLTFGTCTITARGCMILNDSASGDPAVAVFDFGGDKTSTAGSFTISFPTADASNAVIRIA